MKYYQKMDKEQFINFVNKRSMDDTIYFGTGIYPSHNNYEQLMEATAIYDENLIEGWFAIKLTRIIELDISVAIISRMGGGYVDTAELDWYHESGHLHDGEQVEIRSLIEKYWDEVSEYFEHFVWVEITISEDK